MYVFSLDIFGSSNIFWNISCHDIFWTQNACRVREGWKAREREKGRENVWVRFSLRKRKRVSLFVCLYVCACVCVRERARACVSERERERERERDLSMNTCCNTHIDIHVHFHKITGAPLGRQPAASWLQKSSSKWWSGKRVEVKRVGKGGRGEE